MNFLRQLLTTLMMIGVTATYLSLSTLLIFLPRFSLYVSLPVAIANLICVIYFVSRWYPLFLPATRCLVEIPWTREDGAEMESVIEVATVYTDDTSGDSFECCRLAVYETRSGKRVKRKLVGDGVTYLGCFETGIWFFIPNRFYGRKDGLVCFDIQNLEWRCHVPKNQVQLEYQTNPTTGIISVTQNGVDMKMDLRTIPPSPIQDEKEVQMDRKTKSAKPIIRRR